MRRNGLGRKCSPSRDADPASNSQSHRQSFHSSGLHIVPSYYVDVAAVAAVQTVKAVVVAFIAVVLKVIGVVVAVIAVVLAVRAYELSIFLGGKYGSFETENNYFIISISNAGIVQV